MVSSQLCILVIAPCMFFIPEGSYSSFSPLSPIFNASLINVLSFLFGLKTFSKLELHLQREPSRYIIPILLSIYSLFMATIFIGHLQYSVKILFLGFICNTFFIGIFCVFSRRNRVFSLLVVPSGEVGTLKNSKFAKFKSLNKPVLPNVHFDGLVVDFRDKNLQPDWEMFLSNCALQKIKIYNYLNLKETLTGQVDIKHLAENEFGDLNPSEIITVLKRFIDLIFSVVISPILIPLMVLIAVLILLDSRGGIFYIQERMGLGGKCFRVIKFRSMRVDLEGGLFTEIGESHRITKFGKFIRKYRLDELPQFWNVLKGEMSLIGPRPESMELARLYEKEVPFFAYRHVVRPGISGWAQVMHGYAAGVDEMKEKLGYDFYYIKHFSLWLDLLIWYKTIRTVLTGFGSR